MWSELTDEENKKLIKKFKKEGLMFKIMFCLFIPLVMLVVPILGIKYICFVSLLGVIFFALKINIIIYMIICLLAVIPFTTLKAGVFVIGIMSFSLLFGLSAISYEINLRNIKKNKGIKICKTRILKIRPVSNSRHNNYYKVTVDLFINDERKAVELTTGYWLKEQDYVYVVSYGENMDLDYMRILKLEDIESNE